MNDDWDLFDDDICTYTHDELVAMCIEESKERHPDDVPFICFVHSEPGDTVEVNFSRYDYRKVMSK